MWASLHAGSGAIPGLWTKDAERLRRFVEAVAVVPRTGVAGDDLPERFGEPNSLYRRYRRWSPRGSWDERFTTGVPEDALEAVLVDATITTRAQRLASGARGGGGEDLGRSRGGLTTEIHVPIDGRGRPSCHVPTPGRAADCPRAGVPVDGIASRRPIGVRGCDTDAIRAWCAERGVAVVIPSKRDRTIEIPHDRDRYRPRHRIKNLFCRVKDYTRIVPRKDKTSRTMPASSASPSRSSTSQGLRLA